MRRYQRLLSQSKSPYLIKNISRVNSSKFLGPTACYLRTHVELGLSRQKLMMISHCFEFNTNTIEDYDY